MQHRVGLGLDGSVAYWDKCHWSIGYINDSKPPRKWDFCLFCLWKLNGKMQGRAILLWTEWLCVISIKYRFVMAFSLLDSFPLRESQPLTIKPYLIKIQDKIFEWVFFLFCFLATCLSSLWNSVLFILKWLQSLFCLAQNSHLVVIGDFRDVGSYHFITYYLILLSCILKNTLTPKYFNISIETYSTWKIFYRKMMNQIRLNCYPYYSKWLSWIRFLKR